MLPMISVYKETDMESWYNPKYANINFMNYMAGHEGGMDILRNNIRDSALKLYNLNKLQDNQDYFLDKTPRYYHIVHELAEIFPEAKFIFLTRNPVSVFASILDYNFNGNINGLFRPDRLDDLLLAPRIISDWMSTHSGNPLVHYMKYEDLVVNTIPTLNELFMFLGLEVRISGEVFYSVEQKFRTSDAIDRKSLLQHKAIVTDYLGSWKSVINDNQKKSLLLEYLDFLGSETYAKLGYNFDASLGQVKSHSVSFRIPIKWKMLEKYRDCLAICEQINCRVLSRLNHMFNLLEKYRLS